MAEPQTENGPNWKVEDLLDLDHFLQVDTDLDEAGLASRDERIAREHLLPVMEEELLSGDAPISVRSRGIGLWLQQRKAELSRDKLKDQLSLMPGEVFSQVRRLVGLLGGIFMLALGAALVFSLLHKEARYFNAVVFLAATLLPQLLLLFLLLAGFAIRRATGRKSSGGGVAQALVREIMAWLAGKVRAHGAGEKIHSQWRDWKQRTYLAHSVVSLSQSLALMYNLGILAGFAGCLLAMDVRFFWESTPGVAAVETLDQIVKVVSTPWGGMVRDWMPTAEGISATRITMEGAEKIYPSSELVNSAAVWAPFLAGAVIFWGLLPRLLLRIGVGAWGRHSLTNYPFVERRHRELWRRLTALRVETASEGPDDEAVVLLWGGLNPDADDLRKILLQQLRLNPLQTFAAANETDIKGDAKVIDEVGDALAKMNSRVRLVVVVESWALAPREANDFLDELRERVGRKRAIRLLLLGAPGEGHSFSEPSSADVISWEDLVAERKDADLVVYSYRQG